MAIKDEQKKRKASASAPVAEEQVKKVKKVKKVTAETAEAPAKKRKATEDDVSIATKKPKVPKSALRTTKEPATEKDEAESSSVKPAKDLAATSKKKSKKESSSKIQKEVPTEEQATEETSANVEEDSEVDQTEALLKGFESGSDEAEDVEGGLKPDQKVPKIPTVTNQSKKKLKRASENSASEKPGVVYVGRIPHGFYEKEMRAYFTQFGNILRLRLSRNKKTAASKHIAWIEFESATVAEIVAKTMDNYLLFGHILKVKVVPDDQIPAELFKGANKTFKRIPWNKIEGQKLAEGVSESAWEKRIEKEEKRRAEKADKLKDIGYDFDAPALRPAKDALTKGHPQPLIT